MLMQVFNLSYSIHVYEGFMMYRKILFLILLFSAYLFLTGSALAADSDDFYNNDLLTDENILSNFSVYNDSEDVLHADGYDSESFSYDEDCTLVYVANCFIVEHDCEEEDVPTRVMNTTSKGSVVTVEKCMFPHYHSLFCDTFFSGWNTKEDGSGDDYFPGDSLEILQDTTLYGRWG